MNFLVIFFFISYIKLSFGEYSCDSNQKVYACFIEVEKRFTLFMRNDEKLELDCKFKFNNLKTIEFDENSRKIFEKATSLSVLNCPLTLKNPLLHDFLPNIDVKNIKNLIYMSTEIMIPPQKFPIYVKPELFKGLENITKFYFAGAPTYDFSSLIFENFENLKELEIKISRYDIDVLKPLKNLESLILNSNMKEFKNEYLSSQNKLKSLRLNHMEHISYELDSNAFSNLKMLQLLNLRYNKLKLLHENQFENLNNLEYLDLGLNELKSLPENIFENLTALRSLDMSKNLIEELSENTFKHTVSIEILNLEENRLKTITNETFKNLQKLRALYLNNNNIHEVERHAFDSNMDIEELRLHHNLLKKILIFSKLILSTGHKNLKVLDFSYNQITYIGDMKSATGLRTINLEHNLIRNLYLCNYDFANFKFRPGNIARVLFINLSNNQIKNIKCFPKKTRGNEERQLSLDMSYNNINCDCRAWKLMNILQNNDTYISLNSKQLKCQEPEHLRDKLLIDVNPMDFICSNNAEIENAVNVYQEKCKCTLKTDEKALLRHSIKNSEKFHPPETCVENCYLLESSIEFLQKKYHLHRCPDECECFNRPENQAFILNCNSSFNHTSNEGNLTSSLENFELILRNINLAEFPTKSLSFFENITSLNLSYNKITEIFVENLPPKLEYLDISFNKIESMNENLIDFIEKLPLKNHGFKFVGNLIDCLCRNSKFMKLINEMNKRNKISDVEKLECIDGRKFSEIEFETLCTYKMYMTIALITLVALSPLLIIAVIICYKHQIGVWLYIHGYGLWFVTEEELDLVKKWILNFTRKKYDFNFVKFSTQNKNYDGFVCFSHLDKDFVHDQLQKRLETEEGFVLCIYDRNWEPGVQIISNFFKISHWITFFINFCHHSSHLKLYRSFKKNHHCHVEELFEIELGIV